MAKLVKKYFTTTTTWTAPAGVTEVLCIATGGGGAGGFGGANINFGGGGGGGSVQKSQYITVVPNTSYTITIGAGGVYGGNLDGKEIRGGLNELKDMQTSVEITNAPVEIN